MAKHAERPRWQGERRVTARAPVELEVDLYHAHGVERACRSENLTHEGLFVDGPALDVGEVVEVDMALPYLAGRWRVPGRVVYANSSGVGVRFGRLDVPVVWALGRILGEPAANAM
ncbi:PilZ domain-containing protein [Ectothiorhodospiraceae bacterium 2226]|nr:PilZ domain-containing protein [Ectothiorhodospiraceae bacterium 2226]